MNFVAIDFETANRSADSACSVGMVKVQDGQIVEEYYRLIKPPRMNFEPMNIQIHGIRPSDVANEQNFGQLWSKEMRDWIKGYPLVAHNASFDMNVLRALIKTYDLETDSMRYACTVTAARKTYPHLENHKLGTVSEHLGISLNHHQALDDARASAKIMLDVFNQYACQSFDELCVKKGICLKIF
jgi:DNA polymerase-3 subunit epsilon